MSHIWFLRKCLVVQIRPTLWSANSAGRFRARRRPAGVNVPTPVASRTRQGRRQSSATSRRLLRSTMAGPIIVIVKIFFVIRIDVPEGSPWGAGLDLMAADLDANLTIRPGDFLHRMTRYQNMLA